MRRYQTRLPSSVPKARLDQFLAEWLPTVIGRPISKSAIRSLLFAGGVYVNRHRNKNGATPIYSGAVIEVYYSSTESTVSGKVRVESSRVDPTLIVYEDEWLIAVNKPSGLPTQPTVDPNRPNLFDLMKKFFTDRDKVLNPYVGLHHRIDKDTSGLVLFTKKEAANKGVSVLFSEHQIKKSYHCLVWKSSEAERYSAGDFFIVENYLGRVGARNGKSTYGEVRGSGDFASTDFRVIEAFRDAYWLEAMPKTGRTHQIRVHCLGLKMPILGDELYFPEGVTPLMQPQRMLLHASKLSFTHPITNEEILITAPLPNDFVDFLGRLKA